MSRKWSAPIISAYLSDSWCQLCMTVPSPIWQGMAPCLEIKDSSTYWGNSLDELKHAQEQSLYYQQKNWQLFLDDVVSSIFLGFMTLPIHLASSLGFFIFLCWIFDSQPVIAYQILNSFELKKTTFDKHWAGFACPWRFPLMPHWK